MRRAFHAPASHAAPAAYDLLGVHAEVSVYYRLGLYDFRCLPNSDIAMIELLVLAEATRSLSCRVIEYPSHWCFGARSAYSLW
jgi:hypothetical protein